MYVIVWLIVFLLGDFKLQIMLYTTMFLSLCSYVVLLKYLV